jgi:predicted DNA-binding protein
MKTPMVRTTIYLPVAIHRALKMMAARGGISMADLLRESVVRSYKEDMEDIRDADKAMREYRKNPKSAVTLEELIAKMR